MSFGDTSAPFLVNAGPASATSGGNVTTGTQTFAGDKTWNGTITFQKSAQAGIAETVTKYTVSDDIPEFLAIENGSTTDGVFIPQTRGFSTTTNVAWQQVYQITTDTGSNPAGVTNARIGASTALTVRPIHQWQNGNVDVLDLIPLNSGANAALAFNTGANIPTFTTRSPGTKLVLYPAIDGTHTDYAIGMSGTGPWISVPQVASGYQFSFYGGQTLLGLWRGDGLLDNTGTVRATGNTNPPTGSGIELNFGAGIGRVQAYNYTGAVWLGIGLDGLTVALRPSGTATFTAAATVNTHTVPEQLASYTVATLPASPAAGLIAYCSNAAGNGPCIAMGNGSVWKRCDNTATTVA